jgi:predicted transcriptional regulator
MLLRHLGGTDLQTNEKNLISDQSRRSVATWEAALQELIDNGLVVQRDREGEVFEVTKKGYEVAENLRL